MVVFPVLREPGGMVNVWSREMKTQGNREEKDNLDRGFSVHLIKKRNKETPLPPLRLILHLLTCTVDSDALNCKSSWISAVDQWERAESRNRRWWGGAYKSGAPVNWSQQGSRIQKMLTGVGLIQEGLICGLEPSSR